MQPSSETSARLMESPVTHWQNEVSSRKKIQSKSFAWNIHTHKTQGPPSKHLCCKSGLTTSLNRCPTLGWICPSRSSHRLFVRWQPFGFFVGGQLGGSGLIRLTTFHQRLLWCGHRWVTMKRLRQLSRLGAQHSMNKVSHSEEQKHDEDPRKFPRDHCNVVERFVHRLLATGDHSTVVSWCAADLLIPTYVQSTSPNGKNIYWAK